MGVSSNAVGALFIKDNILNMPRSIIVKLGFGK